MDFWYIYYIYCVYIYIYPRCSMVLEYLPTFRVIFRVNVGIYKYSSTMEHIWVLFLYVNLLVANVCVFAWMVFDDVGSSEDAWFQPWNAGLNSVFKEKETLNIGTGYTKILGLQTQPWAWPLEWNHSGGGVISIDFVIAWPTARLGAGTVVPTLLKVATITEKGLEQLSPGGIRLNWSQLWIDGSIQFYVVYPIIYRFSMVFYHPRCRISLAHPQFWC